MSRKAGFTKTDQERSKAMILEILERMPNMQSACQKAGTTRMTCWRWQKEDREFARAIAETLQVSRMIVDDAAESVIIQAINNKEPWAAKWWLSHNNTRYIQPYDRHMRIQEKDWGDMGLL